MDSPVLVRLGLVALAFITVVWFVLRPKSFGTRPIEQRDDWPSGTQSRSGNNRLDDGGDAGGTD